MLGSDTLIKYEEGLKALSVSWWHKFRESELVPLLMQKFSHSESYSIARALLCLIDIKYGKGYYKYYDSTDFNTIISDIKFLLEDWYDLRDF